jgi:hypothetical protein
MLPAYERSRRILERKRRELAAEVAGYNRIQAVRAAGELDNSGLGTDGEIRPITDALRRIDHGECGLWTPYPIRCHEIIELEYSTPTSRWTARQSPIELPTSAGAMAPHFMDTDGPIPAR